MDLLIVGHLSMRFGVAVDADNTTPVLKLMLPAVGGSQRRLVHFHQRELRQRVLRQRVLRPYLLIRANVWQSGCKSRCPARGSPVRSRSCKEARHDQK